MHNKRDTKKRRKEKGDETDKRRNVEIATAVTEIEKRRGRRFVI